MPILLLYALLLYSPLIFSCKESLSPKFQKPALNIAYKSNYPQEVPETPLTKLALQIRNLGKAPYLDAFKAKQKADYLEQLNRLLSRPNIDMRGFYEFITPESPRYVPDVATLYNEKKRSFYAYHPEQRPAPFALTAQKYSALVHNIANLRKKDAKEKAALEDRIIEDIKAIEHNGYTLAGEEYDFDQDMTLIYGALVSDSIRTLKALLEHGGIDPNTKTRWTWKDITTVEGWTPLMIAAGFGNVQAVEYLVALPNIKINATRADGQTAASRAAQFIHNPSQTPTPKKNYVAILKILLRHGAHIEDLDKYIQSDSPYYDEEIAKIVSHPESTN